jgi:hypothetical protein
MLPLQGHDLTTRPVTRFVRPTLLRILTIVLCGVLVTTLACFLTTYTRQHQTYPPDSDEAIHLMEGLTPALDMRTGDLPALVRHIYFQPWYPPLYPILLAAFFAACGAGLAAARLISVALWILSLPLTGLVVRALSGTRQPSRGTSAAVLLAATSPMFLLLAGLCMEESLAVPLVLLHFLFYLSALKEPADGRLRNAVWAGLVLAMVFLTRISTGLFLAATVLLNELPEMLKRRVPRPPVTRTVALFAPVTIAALLWLGHPQKMADFQEYLGASVPSTAPFSSENLTYYSLALKDMYVAAWPLAIWLLAAVLASLRERRRSGVRFMLLHIPVTLVSLMLKGQTNPRFAISVAMAIFILAGYQAQRLIQSWQASSKRRQAAIALLLALTLATAAQPLYHRFATLPFALEVNYETVPEINDIYEWTAQQVPAGERNIVLVNGWDQCSGSALQWYLSTGAQAPIHDSDRVVVEQFDLQDPSDDNLARFAQLLNQKDIRYVLHLEGGPVSLAGAWWAYKAHVQDRLTKVAQQTFTIRLWDGQVIDQVLRNRVPPSQVETVRETMHYQIPIHATLFAVST